MFVDARLILSTYNTTIVTIKSRKCNTCHTQGYVSSQPGLWRHIPVVCHMTRKHVTAHVTLPFPFRLLVNDSSHKSIHTPFLSRVKTASPHNGVFCCKISRFARVGRKLSMLLCGKLGSELKFFSLKTILQARIISQTMLRSPPLLFTTGSVNV